MTVPALELASIQKHFGSVHAVRRADLVLMPGELHALVGENGAGKSTLMRIAAGLIQPDGGRVSIRGVPVALRGPEEARRLGVGMVHQHFTSIPAFTVADNIALGSDWALDPREITRRVRALNERLGFSLDPSARTEDLTAAALQRLEILKVMAAEASILILDEPTAALSPTEGEELLRLVRRLVGRGSSAVLITHKLDEAIRHADRITVLRQGMVTQCGSVAGQDAPSLARAMLGADLLERKPREMILPGETVVRAESIVVAPPGGKGPGIRDATFHIKAGETVGLAAVEGNGERELLRAVAGLVPSAEGTLSVAQPALLVPEDRSTEGIIPDFPLAENLTLGFGRSAPWIHRGIIYQAEALAHTERLLAQYQITAAGAGTAAGSLSGGNQQKLILARALEQKPRVLVAENPGRGLDIRASRDAFERLRAAARNGTGVLIHSGDLDELLDWCDRLLVVNQGTVHTLAHGAGREEIGRLLLAGEG